MLHLYNSLSRTEEPLPDQKKIRLFVCGPTVYDYLHIGNARTYIFFDFFAKLLRARGYDVAYVQNITDVDDKIIARAMTDNTKTDAVARFFTEAYFEDMKVLGVDAVTTYAPATKFITQIVAQVERLIDKGFAYKIDGDGWYFDISKDADYGKLSGRTVEQAEDGVTRIDESVNKRNKGDFCLWKFTQTSLKDLEPRWPSSLGDGRPGWHIEDTAISEFYFGPQYEIHGGGIDLKFPHHEAEIAQQESASGLKPFVQFWVHVGALTVEGRKMSKSVGNFITIREFLSANPAVVLRWIVLSHHYRSPLDFSERVVAQAKSELENLYTLALRAKKAAHDAGENTDTPEETAAGAKWKKAFHAALDEDLNTPKAFSIVFEMLKDDKLSPGEKVAFLKAFDRTAMLDIKEAVAGAGEIPAEITEKFDKYRAFRGNKQFIQSDALRKELESVGYEVRDGAEGSSLVKKFFK
ncbi:MAG TPA: cysteine--tRNA ligase [Candidatus Paceibacterota bacterium]|nr:cysteine--tRNA ligase [Candidatus Paceibacterota bacterium]